MDVQIHTRCKNISSFFLSYFSRGNLHAIFSGESEKSEGSLKLLKKHCQLNRLCLILFL